MEKKDEQKIPAWVTLDDRRLCVRWREYAYDDATKGRPTAFVDKFSECLGFNYGGVHFRYKNRGPNEAPCVFRLRNGGLFMRINLAKPPDDDDAWLPVGLALKPPELRPKKPEPKSEQKEQAE